MKVVIILNGTLNNIIKQSKELNSYISNFLSKDYDYEAWILSNEDIELTNIYIGDFISKVRLIKISKKHLSEDYVNALKNIYQISSSDILLFGSNTLSSELAVRLAYRLNGSSCLNIKNSYFNNKDFIVEKMVYSNNLKANFILKKKPYCLSLAKGFNNNFKIRESLPSITEYKFDSMDYNFLKSLKIDIAEEKESLNNAKTVLALGKGVKKQEIDKLNEFSKLIGGKIGASRPVVLNAWLPMDKLIGASGNVLSPLLCIAIGVSGAAAFSVGIEKSKYIIAINKDKSAPIFKIADVGICGDYKEVVNELICLFKKDV